MEFLKHTLRGTEVLEVPGEAGGIFILLFHGYGANAYDLLPLSQIYQESPKPTWFFPNGPMEIPISLDYVGRAWFQIDIPALQRIIHENRWDDFLSAFPDNIEQIIEFGHKLIDDLHIPLSKLCMGGFSQGAIFSTELALSFPEKIKGLIILSGTLVHESSLKEKAVKLRGLPFFQSHGLYDPLLPFSLAQSLEKFLIGSGLVGKLISFGGGHEIPTSILHPLRDFIKKIL
jgi:phospholipase/carboxylesterase